MQFDRSMLTLVFHLSFVDLVTRIDLTFQRQSQTSIVAEEGIVNRRSFEHRAENRDQFELTGQTVRIVEGLIDDRSQFQFHVFEKMFEMRNVLEKFLKTQRYGSITVRVVTDHAGRIQRIVFLVAHLLEILFELFENIQHQAAQRFAFHT